MSEPAQPTFAEFFVTDAFVFPVEVDDHDHDDHGAGRNQRAFSAIDDLPAEEALADLPEQARSPIGDYVSSVADVWEFASAKPDHAGRGKNEEDAEGDLAFAKPDHSKGGGKGKPGHAGPKDDTATDSEPTSEPQPDSEPTEPAPEPEPAPSEPSYSPGSYVSGLDTPNGYNIEIVFSGTWTDALKNAFVTASEYLSDIIVGDVADVMTSNGVIDDIRIDASLINIDGTGGILGQAGPTSVRSGSYLPATGIMQFDAADADSMLSRGIWEDVIFHEMVHSIGFGTMWSAMGLLQDFGGDLRFTGEQATKAYNTEFANIAANDSLSAYGVPVETDGGAGTAGAHWDESTFRTETMTGWAGGDMYVSDMTIAALEDMGYDTVWDAFA